MTKRNAIIVAVALEVHCPFCGEPQPCPGNESQMWEPREVEAAQGKRICTSCYKSFKLMPQNRVNVGA